jgi:hypothetical protein
MMPAPHELHRNNNNSIQFNSILYYLCAESTATRPITDTAQCRYNNNIIVKQCSNNNDNNNNNSIQFNSILYYLCAAQRRYNNNIRVKQCSNNNDNNNNNSIQLNFLLFMCLVNRYKANYRHSTVIFEL